MFILGVLYFIIIKLLIEVLGSFEYSLFVKENVKRFRIIGYFLFLNFLIEFILIFGIIGKGMRFLDLGFGFYFIVLVFVYFIIFLMSFVIVDGFVKVIKIKEDNDLII